MILGAVELIVVAIPLVQAGLSLQMISLRPRLTANILTLLVCGWLGVKIILHSWEVYQRAGVLHSDDGKDLITQKLGDLAAQLGTAREKIMMTGTYCPAGAAGGCVPKRVGGGAALVRAGGGILPAV